MDKILVDGEWVPAAPKESLAISVEPSSKGYPFDIYARKNGGEWEYVTVEWRSEKEYGNGPGLD